MTNEIEVIWNDLSFPEGTLLGTRIPRKILFEKGELVASDKKYYKENVKKAIWAYALKPSTCAVPSYRDNVREYLEVAVLQVEMVPFQKNKKSAHKRVADIIHKAIQYPSILGFYTENGHVALSIAPKRFNKAKHGALVVDRVHTTEWMRIDEMKLQESAFIKSLAWDNVPLQDYAGLYGAWVDSFIGYECSLLSGTFNVSGDNNRIERLDRCREIQTRISDLRGKLKKVAFNQQVELNVQIKEAERELKLLVNSL